MDAEFQPIELPELPVGRLHYLQLASQLLV
jgi:hypothetical protein